MATFDIFYLRGGPVAARLLILIFSRCSTVGFLRTVFLEYLFPEPLCVSSLGHVTKEDKCRTVAVVPLFLEVLRGKMAQLVQYGTFPF